ncbi:hypothetical protein AC578_8748 [Pseudocercospora eumusae]|uniref:Uncharacterized protein n=1 Tax=Pseudocercospora eumusae TaxID=321146 RepID=A0A139H695_9PEZI|nr:hypothetical protein AC578_8748 [Pseudocercospora eumusae]
MLSKASQKMLEHEIERVKRDGIATPLRKAPSRVLAVEAVISFKSLSDSLCSALTRRCHRFRNLWLSATSPKYIVSILRKSKDEDRVTANETITTMMSLNTMSIS